MSIPNVSFVTTNFCDYPNNKTIRNVTRFINEPVHSLHFKYKFIKPTICHY